MAKQNMEDFMEKKDIESLIQLLKDKDIDIQRKATVALGNIGIQVIEPIFKALREKQIILGEAVDVLGKIGEPAVEPLIKALKDDYVGEAAAGALGEIGDKRAVEPLIQVLGNEKVQWRAALSLGMIGDKRAVEPLGQAFETWEKWRRYVIVEALGNIGDKSAKKYLVPLLELEEVQDQITEALDKIGWKPGNDTEKAQYLVRKRAWEELVDLGEPALKPLIKQLKNLDWVYRMEAASILGEMGDKRAVEPLIEALEDDYAEVRQAAALALCEIKDERAIEPVLEFLKDRDGLLRSHIFGSDIWHEVKKAYEKLKNNSH